ncbi:uncharacterized protein isoform X3 [Macaca fascicularis]|uniref:uncharacterized protein isoform X3 n=1 Tax=Macaca fascicularis TaxID=9541 RepID=UPI003D15C25B
MFRDQWARRSDRADPPPAGTSTTLPASAEIPPGSSASGSGLRSRGKQCRFSAHRHDSDCMAGAELRAALEQRLGALAIHTEVVEHPEVWPSSKEFEPTEELS